MKILISLLTMCVACAAYGQGAKMPHLCFLVFDAGTLESNRYGAFFQTLRERGYVPGKTLRITYLSSESRKEGFPALAAECVRGKADIIATTTTPAAQAAKAATKTVPIVMLTTGDPIGAGLVASLAKPGGNVTGQSFMAGTLAAKRLELLKEVMPKLARVMVLTYSPDPISAPQLRALQDAAGRLGVQLRVQEVRAVADIAPAFGAGLKESPEAMLLTSESIFLSNRARVLELLAQHRLPGVFPWRQYSEGGALMSYVQEYAEMYQNAATYVDRILKGAKPGDLPVGQPTKFDLVVNQKTARALGVTVPQSVLVLADKVID
jgi:putative tryptophan/tyrosine transport system substrate-binding protein